MLKCIKYSMLIIMVTSINIANAEYIDKKSLSMPNNLKGVSLYHEKNEFFIKTHSKVSKIQRCYIDKELRGISKEQLSRILLANAYISINKVGQDDYSLRLNARLNGGGAGGATVGMYAGKFATYFIGYGAITVASALTGPAAGTTATALTLTFGPAIESASNVAAIGCGILGGVATGPA